MTNEMMMMKKHAELMEAALVAAGWSNAELNKEQTKIYNKIMAVIEEAPYELQREIQYVLYWWAGESAVDDLKESAWVATMPKPEDYDEDYPDGFFTDAFNKAIDELSFLDDEVMAILRSV